MPLHTQPQVCGYNLKEELGLADILGVLLRKKEVMGVCLFGFITEQFHDGVAIISEREYQLTRIPTYEAQIWRKKVRNFILVCLRYLLSSPVV